MVRRKKADVDRIVSVHSLIKRKADMMAKSRTATLVASKPAPPDVPVVLRRLVEQLGLTRR